MTKTKVYKSWTIAYYFDLINVLKHKNVFQVRYFSGNNFGNNGGQSTTKNVDYQFPIIPFFGIRATY